jgi:hypothetical protein
VFRRKFIQAASPLRFGKFFRVDAPDKPVHRAHVPFAGDREVFARRPGTGQAYRNEPERVGWRRRHGVPHGLPDLLALPFLIQLGGSSGSIATG